MLLFGVVGFIVWERIRNFLNSAKIPARRSLAARWLAGRQRPGATQSGSAAAEYSTRAKVTTATPFSTFVGPTTRGNSAHDDQFSLGRISAGDIRRLSPHIRTHIYPRPRRARALRRLRHLPGVAVERQTT